MLWPNQDVAENNHLFDCRNSAIAGRCHTRGVALACLQAAALAQLEQSALLLPMHDVCRQMPKPPSCQTRNFDFPILRAASLQYVSSLPALSVVHWRVYDSIHSPPGVAELSSHGLLPDLKGSRFAPLRSQVLHPSSAQVSLVKLHDTPTTVANRR